MEWDALGTWYETTPNCVLTDFLIGFRNSHTKKGTLGTQVSVLCNTGRTIAGQIRPLARERQVIPLTQIYNSMNVHIQKSSPGRADGHDGAHDGQIDRYIENRKRPFHDQETIAPFEHSDSFERV